MSDTRVTVNSIADFLPERYHEPWRQAFNDRVAQALVPGIRILDVGSGRKPALAPSLRPPNCHYVGLDVSARELELAPLGSYDELWVRDVVQHEPELVERFDLILSWQVIEHVKPIKSAFDNLHSYLVPQGRIVALFSGAFSAFALINAIVPDRMGIWAMKKLLRRPPDTVFPAYYDHCWYGGLERVLAPWECMEIVPLYRGAGYFSFAPPLQRLYLHFEEWARRGNHYNFATHYLVDGTR